jgi:hypothetical protein
LTGFDRKLFGSNKKDMLERFYEYTKTFFVPFFCENLSDSSFHEKS